MDSKFIKPHQCSLLERSHAVFRLKLILNSDQDLLEINRFLHNRSTSHKNLQKQNNEGFFIQLFYVWLHLTNNNIPPRYL